MDLNKIYNALNELAETVKTIIKTSMTDAGVDEQSHIIKDFTSEAVGLDLVKVMIHDYYANINNGSHYTQYPPPIEPIRKWCEEKLHTTDNSVVFAIREAIFKRGLKPRPFMGDIILAIDDIYESFGDEVFEIFCEEIDKMMGK